jgi:uncharacterized protein YkwD
MRHHQPIVLFASILGSLLATLPSSAVESKQLEFTVNPIANTASVSALASAEGPQANPQKQQADFSLPQFISRRSTGNPSGLRDVALVLVNQDRARQGLPSLGHNSLLDQVAQAHAEDMIRRSYFSHYTPEGQDPTGRVRRAGSSIGAGENIMNFQARGNSYSQAQLITEFQQQFMTSPRHRANILKSDYQSFGYGFATTPDGSRVVAVQMFGLPQR